MTSATNELRHLLDERGVEWRKTPHYSSESIDNDTVFRGEGIEWIANDHFNGHIGLRALRYEVTPAQAIEATLGRGTCKDVCADVSEFTCGACGFNCELASWISLFDGDDGRHRHHYHGTPNFCPNCGRKVVDE